MGRARVCLAGQVTGNGERPPPETVRVESGRVQQREERRNVRPWSARVHPAGLHACRHAPLLRVSEVGTERRVFRLISNYFSFSHSLCETHKFNGRVGCASERDEKERRCASSWTKEREEMCLDEGLTARVATAVPNACRTFGHKGQPVAQDLCKIYLGHRVHDRELVVPHGCARVCPAVPVASDREYSP